MNKIDLLVELDKRSIDYKIALDPDEAEKFLSKAEAYNQFTSEMLVDLVKKINELIPKIDFGEDNPNTGKLHHKFRVGNEGSRVIHLEIDKFYMPKEFNYNNLGADLEFLARKAKADEYWTIRNDNHKFIYRIWWD